MREHVKREEVESLLGYRITDKEFNEALKYATRKQAYIYEREQRPIVLQHWYLVKLTEEYVSSLAFSRFTMEVYENLHNMEKEHSVKDQSAQKDTHIVAGLAL